MNSQINEAYQSAQKALGMMKTVGEQTVKTLEELAKAEANYDSVVAFVTKREDSSGVSKTALKEVVKGDKDVMEAKARVTELKREREGNVVRYEYCKAYHDLEKKRMSAEMDEAKRIILND